MYVALIALALFLTSPAAAHRGNPCLAADYDDGTCAEGATLKPAPDHDDATRIYGEDEDH